MSPVCSITNKPAYIVIDTNVLISAGLLPESKTAQSLALAVAHFVIAQNQATWHELETRIARPKFDRYFGVDGRLRHLVKIAQSIQRFEMKSDFAVSRDASDDKFIGLALDAGAGILISGDPDLKDVQIFMGVEILSPAQFLERFSQAI
jgi:putative PIN family toxin of toxin-antitoxin system